MTTIFDQRLDYSAARNARLEDALIEKVGDIHLPGLAIFTVGSYGRLEASTHSDVDLFFTYEGEKADKSRRTNEYRLFGRLIDVVNDLGYPDLSNDAEFLQSNILGEMLEHLGSPLDDHRNYFTSRMLLLLESRPLYGYEAYDRIISEIIATYYRDYPRHEDSFRPWFLLNDIMRFWKTLLLNYEHKRNRTEDRAKIRSKVKNFKLKYSRATTCFATIAAIGSATEQVTPETIRAIVKLTPRQRLDLVKNDIPSLASQVDDALADYAWFLEQTGLPTEELEAMFQQREARVQMFTRAESFGDKLFAIVSGIDRAGDGRLLRSLVV